MFLKESKATLKFNLLPQTALLQPHDIVNNSIEEVSKAGPHPWYKYFHLLSDRTSCMAGGANT